MVVDITTKGVQRQVLAEIAQRGGCETPASQAGARAHSRWVTPRELNGGGTRGRQTRARRGDGRVGEPKGVRRPSSSILSSFAPRQPQTTSSPSSFRAPSCLPRKAPRPPSQRSACHPPFCLDDALMQSPSRPHRLPSAAALIRSAFAVRMTRP